MTNASELDQKYVDMLVKIYKYEQEHVISPSDNLGWEWDQVKVPGASLNALMLKGYIKNVYHSHNHKGYVLEEAGKNIAIRAIEYPNEDMRVGVNESNGNEPDNTQFDTANLFNDIVGYSDIKDLIKESLLLPKPIHVLLQGPPSVAKSMFLSDIERAAGNQALWLLGSATSKAGLWEAIIDIHPKYLLIDELDKASGSDLASLLSLMQNQRLTRVKANKRIDIPITCWVFASANRIEKIAPELLSRFKIKRLQEYNSVEYAMVIQNVLIHQEGVNPDDATEIARLLYGRTHDVRDAIRVGRMATRTGVKRAVELLID